MNYTITGSLGNISLPLVKDLLAAGHKVKVISSNDAKKKEIEQLGATAAIGSVNDKGFLANAFAGSDAVYLMIPPNFATSDFYAYQKEVADNYIHAIKENNTKHIVLLSSIGAHMRKGAGPIDGLGYLEEQLEKLKDVNVKMLRPSYFYFNLFAMAGLIKQAGIMGSNFGDDKEKLILVHPADIAKVAAKHLLALDFTGHTFQYIASDEKYASEIATTISSAINKPNTPWVTFTDEQALEGMLQGGLSKTMAEAYVQMGKAFREGLAQADYWENKPAFGNIKLEEFAKDFAAFYSSN